LNKKVSPNNQDVNLISFSSSDEIRLERKKVKMKDVFQLRLDLEIGLK